MSTFPSIADYGFLSDCEHCCLIAPNGAVEWLCLPRPDSPSIFGALLDRTAGLFRFGPSLNQVPNQRRYLPGTLVLETTWHTPTGWLVVTDLLVIGPSDLEGRRPDYRRAPSDFGATGTLLRIATCISGRVEVMVNCVPAFDYGRAQGTWAYEGTSYESLTVTPPGEGPTLTLTSSIGLGLIGARSYGRTSLEQGESAFTSLTWRGEPVADLGTAMGLLDETVGFWRGWLSNATFPDHPWRPYIEQSALTLKGLSYAPTGAIMAASTTSLPETPGGERNWDYRYTWIRDTGFMLRALYTLGLHWEAIEYFAFVFDAVASGSPGDDVDLQIMYGIGGERDLTEHLLTHLSGYRGSRPVRIGNGAYDQKQHDVWGMLLDAVETHLVQGANQILGPAWEYLAGFVDDAIAQWQDTDQGIWEVRGEPKHFTASKVLCWVAVDRGVRLAQDRDNLERVDRWKKAAQEMKDDICEKGVNEAGRFRQHYETDELDASLLLIPILGFLPPEDPRVRTTVLAIADELTKDDLVLRYKVDSTDTGFSGEEGTFTICSFWLVTALAMIGETARSRALCEKLLSYAGPLGLYAEEIDTSTGEHLGNFPQAFTHLAMIDALTRLIAAEAAPAD